MMKMNKKYTIAPWYFILSIIFLLFITISCAKNVAKTIKVDSEDAVPAHLVFKYIKENCTDRSWNVITTHGIYFHKFTSKFHPWEICKVKLIETSSHYNVAVLYHNSYKLQSRQTFKKDDPESLKKSKKLFNAFVQIGANPSYD